MEASRLRNFYKTIAGEAGGRSVNLEAGDSGCLLGPLEDSGSGLESGTLVKGVLLGLTAVSQSGRADLRRKTWAG